MATGTENGDGLVWSQWQRDCVRGSPARARRRSANSCDALCRMDEYGAYLKQNSDAITAISPTIWHLAQDGVSLTADDATMAAAAKLKRQAGVRVLPTVFDNESYNQGTLKPRLLKLFAHPEQFIAAVVNASVTYGFDGVNLVRSRGGVRACAYARALPGTEVQLLGRTSSHAGVLRNQMPRGCCSLSISCQTLCMPTVR